MVALEGYEIVELAHLAQFSGVAHGGEIYIRPARGHAWPLVFLDDLSVPVARQLGMAHGAMIILTSPAGGCHVWLPCDQALDEDARLQAQARPRGPIRRH